MDTVAAMQPGWNLGNTFDSTGSDETSWGNPVVTQQLLQAVKAQGFNSIRIPVTWMQHLGAAPNYTIDPTYLARVKQVVDWALADGFYVMINIHHDSWEWVTNMPTQHDAVLAEYSAVWTQIAAAFKDETEKLVLESINEQAFTGSSGDAQNASLMNELNTTFHNIVRASGSVNATRLLVLPTLGHSGDPARIDEVLQTFTALNDPNLIASVHYYGFWPFSVNIAGYTTFTADTQQDVTSAFDRLYNSFVSRGIPVIIGEYGLLGWDAVGWDSNVHVIEPGEQAKFFEYLGYYARTKRLTTMLWDNGGRFNRTTYQWRDPDLFAQIQSSWTTRSCTASTDQIFVGKTAPPASQTVTLSYNGTTLSGIYNGTTPLVAGTDYTVSGNQLTLSAALLSSLTASKIYGVNAVLTARFSQGLPWKFNVITYSTPVLQRAQGTTTAGLVIPTAFNGDVLATMEAKYTDGSGAGPNNWTSYKEFARTFLPDYTANTVTLTSTFFAEINRSTVILTFHFWSGTNVTYTLNKKGGRITGTP